MIDSPEKPLSKEQKVQKETEVRIKTADAIKNDFINFQIISEEIKNETDRFDNEKVQYAKDIPKVIKDRGNNRTNIGRIAEAVKQTLIAIKIDRKPDGTYSDDHNIFPPASRNTIRRLALSIDVNDINERNAVFLYSIFNLGYTDRLKDAPEIKSAFNSIKTLEFIDINLHDKIAKGFQECILSLPGLSDDERKNYIESLKTDSQKKAESSVSEKTKQELEKLRDESESIMHAIHDAVEQMTDPTRNANRLDNLVGDDRLTKTIKAERDAEIENRLYHMKTDLWVGMNDLIRYDKKGDFTIPTDDDLLHSISGYRSKFENYFKRGIIKPDEYTQLVQSLNRYKEIAMIQLNEMRKNQGRALQYLADTYSGVTWERKEYDLIGALDSTDKLREKVSEYNNLDTYDDWKRFYKDIKGVFEQLFEIPQAKPKQFWEQAFNPLHEGFFYQMMVQKLRGLGEIIKTDEYFRNKKVWVDDIFDELSPHDVEFSTEPGHMKLSGRKLVQVGVSTALKTVLHDQMIHLQDVREYLHNISIISLMGMGWDKMAEYSARLDIKNIDLLFYTTEGLSEAYNTYLQSMYQELAINGHMMWTNFGKKNNFGLDPIEERTYRQLAALRGVTDLDNKEIKRLIKIAGDLSKGVFGEFWGAAMTSRFPLLTKDIYELDAKGNKIIDPVTKQWRIKQKALAPSYLSISYPGLEKMLKDLDIDYQLQRFTHPRFWDSLRYAFAPRDVKNHHIYREYQNIPHGEIYTYGRMDDNAFLQGRNDKMATFDSKYIMWKDKMRTSSVDFFLRGAWRFYQYEKYFVYKKDADNKMIIDPARNNQPILDFHATMKKLQGLGPYAVQLFIDDFFDNVGRENKFKDIKASESDMGTLGIEDLAKDVISDLVSKFEQNPNYKNEFGNYRAKGSLSDTEQKLVKRLLQKEYIFERLAAMRPTHFLAMETQRYTPENEILLTTRMETALKNIFKGAYPNNYIKGNLLPIYIGALEMVENKIYQNKKAEWRKSMDSGVWPTDDTLKYTLTDADFNNPEVKKALISYYHLSRTQSGAIPLEGAFIQLQDEEFFHHVKTMFSELRKGIDDPNRKDEFSDSQTLVERYSLLMSQRLGNVNYYIKGNLFDFSEFMFQQAGSRSPERMWGEVGAIATKMTPALTEIIYSKIGELVKTEYPDNHAFEKAVTEKLVEPFRKWFDAVNVVDPEGAMRESVYLVTFLAQALGKDRNMRMKVLGDIMSSFARRTWGTQGSLITDFFWSTVRRPTTSLDSDGIETLVHTLLSSVNMPLTKNKIVGTKKGPFGIQIPDMKDEWGDRNMELVEEINGVRMRDRLWEASPIFPVIFLLIALMLAKLAWDKDKKKG